MKRFYEIGATWSAITPTGITGKYWLESVDGPIQIWRWEVAFPDGSGVRKDWGPSRSHVRNQLQMAMYRIYSNGTPRQSEKFTLRRIK